MRAVYRIEAPTTSMGHPVSPALEWRRIFARKEPALQLRLFQRAQWFDAPSTLLFRKPSPRVAPEGKCSLDPYPNVRAWLTRLEALPRFLPMPRTVIED